MLLSVPNLSIGSGRSRIDQLEAAFGSTATLLDSHSDGTHGRTVLTLAAPPPDLYESLLAGAEAAIDLIDLGRHSGAHPCIGALDVCPVVYPGLGARKLATELAARVAAGLAELGLPVFLYGDLASSEPRRERHFFRRGGLEVLRQRMLGGELDPDYGPAQPHPTAGAALVTARPPLAAFNVELEGTSPALAQEIAASVREAGGGPVGVRAIAIDLGAGRMQISTNVHDPAALPLASLVAEIQRLAAPGGGRAVAAELVGLVPEAALRDYPGEVPIRDFDPGRRTIEARLAQL